MSAIHAPAAAFAKLMESIGVRYIIYTDIATDGMLNGPNIEAMAEMLENVNVNIIASGGVTTLNDVKKLAALAVERRYNRQGAIYRRILI